MRYLSLDEVLLLHQNILRSSGGEAGIREIGSVDSVVSQPRMTFGGKELYPSIVEKAAALGFSLIRNHPFVDGNKRTGHAAMEIFLVMNGYEIRTSTEEQENIILQVASGELSREGFEAWLRSQITEMES